MDTKNVGINLTHKEQKMNYFPKVVILTAESPVNDKLSNEQKTALLSKCLEDVGMNFAKGTGFFHGKGPNTSFVVTPRNDDEIETLKSFAFKTFGQQSILLQDNNQEAYLIHHDGTEKRLGRLQAVSQAKAEEIGSYTILNGVYYSTVPRPA